MPANRNWARWIHASLGKYIKTTADSISVPCIVEGIIERDEAFMQAPDRIEGRINGPFTQELSAGYHRVQVDVNIIVNSMMGGETKNAYKLDEILGVLHNALDGALAIYRFGTGPEDDPDSLLGCLTPRPGKNDNIRVIHFGQIDTNDRLKQGMVDARYVMYLNE
jgi:hypothetical protein